MHPEVTREINTNALVKLTGLIWLVLILLIAADLHAQHDSTAIATYDELVTSRFYFSKKFTALRLLNKGEYNLNYFPNTTLNMGVGATYKWATLNLAYGFGFLNPERGRGDTRYLDLQFHNYGRKIVIDVLGQFYRGFYIENPQFQNENYVRPDLHVNHIGASIQYVFNGERFSYRAAFIQNERQKISQGSFLAGLEIYGGWISADSVLVPSAIQPGTSGDFPRDIDFIQGGLSAGYAYTAVVRNYYATGSLSLGVDYGKTDISGSGGDIDEAGFAVSSIYKFVVGYNSDAWALAVSFVSNHVRLPSVDAAWTASLNTGNLRASYVYRFMPGRRLKRVLRVFDRSARH